MARLSPTLRTPVRLRDFGSSLAVVAGGGGEAPADEPALLMETGDTLLLESGDELLMES